MGAVVALFGLILLVSTLALRVDADDSNCASLNSPERAQECVAESAQALDRERLSSMFAVGLAVTAVTVGATLVVRARRRVMDIAEAAELVDTDVRGIRSLIANGDLVSVTSEGHTFVDATSVERLRREPRDAKAGAPRGAV